MISIALVGAPGSGKTELATALSERLDGPTFIIDDYVDEVSKRLDVVAGFRADYYTNLAIAIERIAMEKKIETAQDDGALITVGSLLETSVYTAMQFERKNKMLHDDAEKQDMLRRVEATLKTLACFYMDSFFYDCVFYLPPTAANEEYELFDKNLQASFEAFYLNPVYTLKTESVDDRVDEMLQQIEEAKNESDAEGSGTPAQEAG